MDILQKLKIKAPHTLYVLNAPDDFASTLGKLPAGITISGNAKAPFDSVHWFITTQAEVEKQTPAVLKLLSPGVTIWCYYPKGSGGIQTDLTRDKGWDALMKHDLKWLSLVSFNATWSAFALRLKTEKDKQQVPVEREIFKYADSATKTITLPEDLAVALKGNKDAKKLFDALAFSHRREYVEWIVTAKCEETRKKRVDGTITLLLEGNKNPGGR
jgi:hypothetical protein